MPLNNPGASTAPFSQAQASPSMRGFTPPVTTRERNAFKRSTTSCDKTLAAGVAVMTPGVAALGKEAVDRIVKTVAVFDDFCHANDPYEEHDFGSFDAEGHTIFFKIDYFDRNLKYLSPDPTCENAARFMRSCKAATRKPKSRRRLWIRRISCELVRNTGACGYRFKQAHEKASQRRKEASDKPRKMMPDRVELIEETRRCLGEAGYEGRGYHRDPDGCDGPCFLPLAVISQTHRPFSVTRVFRASFLSISAWAVL
jgi:hypothetical protein